MGHGGDTYGFLSEQGIIGQLGNASFSVVSNEDYEGSFVQHSVACRPLQSWSALPAECSTYPAVLTWQRREGKKKTILDSRDWCKS